MEKIKKLNIITGIVLTGFLFAIIYHFILGNFFSLEYPYNTFLFDPKYKFSDYFNIYNIFEYKEFNPYNQDLYPCVNYFPFGTFFQYIFALIPLIPSFIICFLISVFYFCYYNYQNIKINLSSNYKINIFISFFAITFLSYPFLVCMDRGNIEITIFIFIALFVRLFSQEKYLKSALLLSLPIAIKGYPLIFLSLFLIKKKFKEIFYCLLAFSLLTFISLFLMKGNISTNLFWYSKQIHNYIEQYAIYNGGLGWGSSLFGIVKFIIFWINGCFKPVYYQLNDTFIYLTSFVYIFKQEPFIYVKEALKIFTPVSAIMILAITCYVMFIEKELWKQILLLLICSIIFTPVSGDYKLLNLFIPLWLFINSKNKSKNDLLYTILFGLILIPKSYIQFFSTQGYNYFSISIILNPLILLIMLFTIIIENINLNSKFSSKN